MTIETIALVEAILMAADEPLTLDEIHAVLAADGFKKSDIHDALKALKVVLEEDQGGVELVEVASGWRLQVPARFAKWVGKLYEEKQNRYSTALFETIALIAYQQPVTRGDIEAVRGVSVSSNIIKTLEEREWIKVIGRRETPGRPMLYATTEQFLDDFNLKSIEELPLLPELEALLEDSSNGSEEMRADTANETQNKTPNERQGAKQADSEETNREEANREEAKREKPPQPQQIELEIEAETAERDKSLESSPKKRAKAERKPRKRAPKNVKSGAANDENAPQNLDEKEE